MEQIHLSTRNILEQGQKGSENVHDYSVPLMIVRKFTKASRCSNPWSHRLLMTMSSIKSIPESLLFQSIMINWITLYFSAKALRSKMN